ncbi:MAG TPA: hypothetical protein VKM54_02405 [Myxococcota bacterium]|nr:hypothetical protein [Myxococcota bacterium]
MSESEEDSAVILGDGLDHAVLLMGGNDAWLVLRSLGERRPRHLSNLPAQVQPPEERPEGCDHVPAGLRLQILLREPQREVLQLSVRDLVNAGVVEEGEVAAGPSRPLELPDI